LPRARASATDCWRQWAAGADAFIVPLWNGGGCSDRAGILSYAD
jgi:hypothetical protein